MISQDAHRQLFLNLPPEILTKILLYLPNSSLLTCTRVNHYLHDLISNSFEIQYTFGGSFTTQLNSDSPRCLIPVKERLELLSRRETQWEELTHDFRKSLNVPFSTSGIYDLTGGVYLLGDAARRELHYTYLSSKEHENQVWNSVRTDHSIIDMGLCVYEHDLLAIITTHVLIPNLGLQVLAPTYEIRLQLHSVSTGLLHPEAEQPIISVVNTPWERPAVGIEIVGDNIVLILSYYDRPDEPPDLVFIYQWKTGKLKMSFTAPYLSYSGLLFLTANIFLLPNTNTEQLEYWKIPPDSLHVESPQPFFALSLPKLRGTGHYHHISCRADPNPTSTFRHSSKPFHADPHHAIAIFSLSLRGTLGAGMFPHLLRVYSFVFFVHRSSLVQCLDKFSSAISYDGVPQPIPYPEWGKSICRWFAAEAFPTRWITTTAGQRCVIIPHDSLQAENTPLVLLNFNQNDIAKLSAIEKRERTERVRTRLAKQRLIELRREGKGKVPQNLDQLVTTFEQTIAEMNIADSKCDPAAIPSAPDDEEELMDILSDDDDDDMAGSSRYRRRVKVMTRQNDVLDDTSLCFRDRIYSDLPYTVCSSEECYKFQGALLDEERIIGLGTNPVNHITTLDIFHYG